MTATDAPKVRPVTRTAGVSPPRKGTSLDINGERRHAPLVVETIPNSTLRERMNGGNEGDRTVRTKRRCQIFRRLLSIRQSNVDPTSFRAVPNAAPPTRTEAGGIFVKDATCRARLTVGRACNISWGDDSREIGCCCSAFIDANARLCACTRNTDRVIYRRIRSGERDAFVVIAFL
jgi:hypothetical protein